MPANLAMDDKLLEKAQKIGGLKTKKDTVTLALKEFIQRRQQEKIIDVFGTVKYAEDYDYKKARNRK